MLNIGLTVDSVCSDKYAYELALWAKGQPDINISHLIVHPRHRASMLGKLKDLLLRRRLHLLPAKILFKAIVLVEKLLLRHYGLHKDHYRSCDLSKVIDRVVEIRPIVSKSGHVVRFSDEDVEKIKALDLDLL